MCQLHLSLERQWASNLGSLDASAGLASHARKEDEGWTKKTLKAQTEGLAEIISDFFNSIDHPEKVSH
jgi:hypothetical protein